MLGVGLVQQASVADRSTAARLQPAAPAFTLPTFDGEVLTLAQYRGRPVVVNFWASWCPPCRAEAPVLERIWETYREAGVLVVGVDIQDVEADARAFLQEHTITYPNVRDAEGTTTAAYRVSGLPAIFLIAGDGTMARRKMGPITEPELVAWVDELLAGDTPSAASPS